MSSFFRVFPVRASSLLAPAAALLAIVGVSASCGGGDDASGPTSAGHDGGSGTVATPAPASASIGAAGGTVASSVGTSVVIPPGALAAAETITVTPSPSAPLASSFVAVGTPYILGPEGLTFASPVTVTLDIDPSRLPAGTTGSDVHVYTAPVGSIAFTTLPTTLKAATQVTAPTMHFSIFVPGVAVNAIADGGASAGDGGDGGSDGGPMLLPDGGKVDTVPTPNEAAGTRLHPIYKRTDFGDGAMTLARIGMYDEQRQEPCDAAQLSDGNMYCAPSGVLATLPEVYFTDAACTAPILGVQFSAPPVCADVQPVAPHRYLLTQSTATCGTTTHVFAAPAAARIMGSTIYVRDSNGNCDATGFDATQTEAYPQSALTELTPADLVPLTRSAPTGTGAGRLRAAPTVLTGSDGSRWAADGQLVDAQTGSICALSWGITDKTQRCTPSGLFYEWYDTAYYADTSCRTPAYDILSSSCDLDPRTSATYAASSGSYDSDGCFDTDTVSIVGDVPAQTLYTNYPCTLATSTSGGTYFTGPAPSVVPASTFVAVSQMAEDAPTYGVNGSRIHAQNVHLLGDDGSDVAQLATVPVDTQSGLACTPVTLSDGAVHCVPPTRRFIPGSGPSSVVTYADAACTQGVVALVTPTIPTCSRSTPTPLYTEIAGRTDAGCQTITLYRATGAPLPATASTYSKSDGTCTLNPGPANDTLYLASDMAKVDPAELVTMSLSLETR